MGQFFRFRLARFTGLDRLDVKPLTLRNRSTDIYPVCLPSGSAWPEKWEALSMGWQASPQLWFFTISSVFFIALAS
jgi:hypothetical protein